MTTDPQNLLPGLHEAMRLLKQNDLDYGPGRILERIKELGGVDMTAPREFWLVGRKDCETMPWSVWSSKPACEEGFEVIHCREVVDHG